MGSRDHRLNPNPSTWTGLDWTGTRAWQYKTKLFDYCFDMIQNMIPFILFKFEKFVMVAVVVVVVVVGSRDYNIRQNFLTIPSIWFKIWFNLFFFKFKKFAVVVGCKEYNTSPRLDKENGWISLRNDLELMIF